MADGILPTANHGSASTPHAYNVPGLSPIEFLYAVMNATNQPISIRIEAAKALLPYTHPALKTQIIPPRCTIVIPPLEPRTQDHEFCPPPAGDPTGNHSQNPDPASITVTRNGEAVAPLYTETTSNPPSLIAYSQPPSPSDLQEIKAAINRLRPDLAHLPVPEPHLCACGHWIFGPCPLGERCRDRSKLN